MLFRRQRNHAHKNLFQTNTKKMLVNTNNAGTGIRICIKIRYTTNSNLLKFIWDLSKSGASTSALFRSVDNDDYVDEEL
ncbi:hypothetical protein SESBI_17828 [Sesbania bispinosa]|nr:hypothetical protein SESBI_17828 [Sesbania bispinosa]